ncbi:hypothetical protein DesLBE_5233 [Desulfitobacterium sp. LBE]|uniref:Uncharacterized protein n=1 Tax=Desulfitobacterium hafniense TaxID=49338 RepID=A0A098B0F2_DESHA|nr:MULTISPECIES: hypothetical protein [Desulfitobacterium]KTE89891.1 hypothetical protein AT727_11125 [Desulfitobacterium hafniense]TWH60784.1 hypothetical protein DesLBE_5233 [Desulfitobacterium sp. LBE]CDX02348.1 Hypothetical protein DPCES_2461 [Desulfitobacterium hafniense]
MKIRIGNEVLTEHIRARIRLDFRGEGKSGRFIFGGKTQEEIAEQVREQEVALLRNVPMQGIFLEDIDVSLDLYTVTESDGRRKREVAYAPIILTLRLENLDDLLPFTIKPEFRKIEFLSPENLQIHRLDVERLFFRVSQSIQEEVKKAELRFQ